MENYHANHILSGSFTHGRDKPKVTIGWMTGHVDVEIHDFAPGMSRISLICTFGKTGFFCVGETTRFEFLGKTWNFHISEVTQTIGKTEVCFNSIGSPS